MATKPEKRPFDVELQDGTKVSLTVRKPTIEEQKAARKQYSLRFNEALFDGKPTRTVMLRRLRENGLWNPADEQEYGQLRSDFQAAQKALEAGKFADPEAVAEATAKRDELLAKFNGKRMDIESMIQFTADGEADDAAETLLICCVIEKAPDAAGKVERMFKKVEDWDNCTDGDLLQRCKYEFTMLETGQPSKWEDVLKASGRSTTDAKPQDKPEDKPPTEPKTDAQADAIADAKAAGEPAKAADPVPQASPQPEPTPQPTPQPPLVVVEGKQVDVL